MERPRPAVPRMQLPELELWVPPGPGEAPPLVWCCSSPLPSSGQCCRAGVGLGVGLEAAPVCCGGWTGPAEVGMGAPTSGGECTCWVPCTVRETWLALPPGAVLCTTRRCVGRAWHRPEGHCHSGSAGPWAPGSTVASPPPNWRTPGPSPAGQTQCPADRLPGLGLQPSAHKACIKPPVLPKAGHPSWRGGT